MASIAPFTHRKVAVLRQDATVHQAAHAMHDGATGCVIISNYEGHLIGIVTDRDLIRAIIADAENKGCPINQLMSSPLISTQESGNLEEVIRLMQIHGVRRIPVIRSLPGGGQKCVGIVTLDDLITSRSIDEYPLIRIIKSQMRKQMFQRDPPETGHLHLAENMEPKIFDSSSIAGLYQEIAHRFRLERYQLNPKQFNEMITLTLEALVKRLHHTGAMHLISQLPVSLQNKLLEIPAGPDRKITVSKVLFDLQTRFGMSSEIALQVMTGICNALDKIINDKELHHVKAQLPEDFQGLFLDQHDKAA